ncbi:hypothetical protein TNCV_3744301 [Trichonephila clavipes]|nr:hypothetical protein TNCV_3744301 [Trichonephila clavipes]
MSPGCGYKGCGFCPPDKHYFIHDPDCPEVVTSLYRYPLEYTTTSESVVAASSGSDDFGLLFLRVDSAMTDQKVWCSNHIQVTNEVALIQRIEPAIFVFAAGYHTRQK